MQAARPCTSARERAVSGATEAGASMMTSTIQNITAVEKGVRVFEVPAVTERCRIPPCPWFVCGDFNENVSSAFFNRTHLWPQRTYVVENAEIIGPFAVRRSGHWYAFPHANMHQGPLSQMASEYAESADRLQTIQVDTPLALIVGPGYRVYGHWIVDILPKLFVLKESGFDIDQLRFPIPQDTPRFGLDWLRAVGIHDDAILSFDPKREKLLAKELYVPTTMHNGVRGSPLLERASQFILSRIGVEAEGTSNRPPAFLSRAKTSQTRRLVNRQEVENIFSASGFEIVYPEALPLLEQIKLCRGRRLLAGEYGSALHTSFFCAPRGLCLVALRGNSVHPEFIQSALGESLRHPTGYLIGKNVDPTGAFELNPKVVELVIRSVLDTYQSRLRPAD